MVYVVMVAGWIGTIIACWIIVKRPHVHPYDPKHGTADWAVEALVKIITDNACRAGEELEWNRDPDTGRITGLVHTIEVNMIGEGAGMGASLKAELS